MRRLTKIILVTLMGCAVVLLAAWATSAAYSRYREATERIAVLEGRVQELRAKAHAPWDLRRANFRISTTDQPGALHDFRLAYGTNEVQTLRPQSSPWKDPGRIIGAWVSDWTPRSEMAKFERFDVSASDDSFEVLAKARSGESVAMEFTITCIREAR